MFFIAISAVLAWFLSSPISFYSTVEDSRLALHAVHKEIKNNIEGFTLDECGESSHCKCVALIHGMGDSAYTWTQTLTAKRSTWDSPIYFYALNLPGSSKSKALSTKEEYRVQNMAKLLLQTLPDRCKQWTLVGNSFGGWISIKMAALAPEKIDGLLLLGSAGVEADYSYVISVFKNPTVENLKDFQKKAYAKPQPLPSFILSSLSKRLQSMPIIDMIEAQTKEDLIQDDLKRLKVPIYLMWGEKDQICPLSFAQKMKELQPKANLEIVKDCGHLPQKECFKDFAKNLNFLLKDQELILQSNTNVQ